MTSGSAETGGIWSAGIGTRRRLKANQPLQRTDHPTDGLAWPNASLRVSRPLEAKSQDIELLEATCFLATTDLKEIPRIVVECRNHMGRYG